MKNFLKKFDRDTILIVVEAVLILLSIGAIIFMAIDWRHDFYPVTDGELII